VLEEEAALLEGAEEFQVAGSKCKEIAAGDEEVQWPFKKARGEATREVPQRCSNENGGC